MRNTDDLRQALMESEDLDRFETKECGAALQRLFEGTDISKAELARRSGMSTVYLYQVFSGRRRPSRDRILCLCFGLGCSLESAQKLLKKGGYLPLYPKNRRDAIILFALSKGMSLQETNDRLFRENEETLS